MTHEIGLSQEQQVSAIAYVRRPHQGLDPDRGAMDRCELGARRFIDWLARNGYTIVKARE